LDTWRCAKIDSVSLPAVSGLDSSYQSSLIETHQSISAAIDAVSTMGLVVARLNLSQSA